MDPITLFAVALAGAVAAGQSEESSTEEVPLEPLRLRALSHHAWKVWMGQVLGLHDDATIEVMKDLILQHGGDLHNGLPPGFWFAPNHEGVLSLHGSPQHMATELLLYEAERRPPADESPYAQRTQRIIGPYPVESLPRWYETGHYYEGFTAGRQGTLTAGTWEANEPYANDDAFEDGPDPVDAPWFLPVPDTSSDPYVYYWRPPAAGDSLSHLPLTRPDEARSPPPFARQELTPEDREAQAILSGERQFALRELQALPTLTSGQADDLKIEILGTSPVRVWLSRMTIEDGMAFDQAVTVETWRNGRWQEHAVYEALDDLPYGYFRALNQAILRSPPPAGWQWDGDSMTGAVGVFQGEWVVWATPGWDNRQNAIPVQINQFDDDGNFDAVREAYDDIEGVEWTGDINRDVRTYRNRLTHYLQNDYPQILETE